MKNYFLTILTIFSISLFSFAQGPEMVFVEGGDFYMGNDYSKGALEEKPEHKVSVDDFQISKNEVTFEEFDKFCVQRGYPMPDDGGFGRGKNPVMNVSWEGAIKFCNWLSTTHKFEKVYDIEVDSSGLKIKSVDYGATGFRLPTEAEWEYAAKGGSQTQGFAYCGSNNLDEVAWYSNNANDKPHDVGTATPNELGIYDLSGNVWEWCWDFYDAGYYANSPETDPRGPDTGTQRVYRGGCFTSDESFLRLTRRFGLAQSMSSGMIGIRLVRKP